MGDWFAEGLRFGCTECGECCTGRDGYVWLTEREATAIADHLGSTVDAFGRRFLRRVGDRLSLVERTDGACALLDETTRHCTVYPVRPTQCRTYPFWPSIVATEDRWNREAAHCPGIGRNPRHDANAIRARVAATEAGG